jgi:S1-C subfamily serine protease
MQAGIKSGDVILAFNGITVDNDEAMRNAVFSAPVISQITILSRGGEAAEIKDITLRGQPMRIGISWRNDAAEPSTSMISRVVPGSPADVAGLKFADRIHAVNGIPWSDTAAEPHPLNNIALPFTIDYERNGRIYSTKLIAPHNRRLLDLSGIDRDK